MAMEKYDHYLKEAITSYTHALPDSVLKTAIAYALSGTGKRLRPKLMLSLIESQGMDAKPFIHVALALELVHTYSLVHDDLPAMDDDDLRRGQLTTHKKFDEATAILVGDALLSDAFGLIAQTESLDAQTQMQMTQILAQKIGSSGMVYGQILDIASEGQNVTADDLMAINLHKTSYLLEASIMMGALSAGIHDLKPYEILARDLGLLYQIQDDLLEFDSDERTLGKSFSDERRNKPTFVTLLNKEGADALAHDYADRIQEAIQKLHLKETPFESIITSILQRTY